VAFSLGRLSTDWETTIVGESLPVTFFAVLMALLATLVCLTAFSKDLKLMFKGNQAQLYQVLDSMPIASLLVDTSGIVRESNAAACTLLSYELHELIGMRIDSIIWRVDLEALPKDCLSVLNEIQEKKRGAFEGTVYVRSKNDSKIPVLIDVAWRRLNGQEQALVAIIDKSENSNLREIINESMSFQQVILQHIPYCVIGVSCSGTISVFNDAARSFFNIPSSLLGDRSYASVEHPELFELLRAAYSLADATYSSPLQTGTAPLPFPEGSASVAGEQKIIRADGTSALFSYSVVLMKDEEGKNNGFLVIGSDHSEQRSKDLMVNRALIKLQLATQAADIGVWTWDLSTNEIEIDRRIRDIYGIKRKDRRDAISYEYWLERVHPDDRAQFEARIQRAKVSALPFTYTYRAVTRDESTVHIQTSAVFELDENSCPLRMIGINRNISEQVTYQQRTQEASAAATAAAEAKSNFLANMSHEIRTPMNAILGFTTLLIDSPLSSTQRMYLERVQTSSQALLSLLNDILDHTKIEAGKLSFEVAPFDLNKVVEQVTSLFSLRFIEKKLTWRVVIDPKTPTYLMGDSLRLGQVLINLVDNAIKFTEAGEVVLSIGTLGAGRKNKTLSFAVSDTGTGISTSSVDQVFKPFFQSDTSISRKFGGTGLGLWIAKQLVKAMGGDLAVESELGKGSVFSFTVSFRLSEAEVSATQVGSESEFAQALDASSKISGAHILLVDDNRINQQLCQLLLTKLGVTFTAASDGQQAIDACNTLSFDMILMDLQMPGVDGLTASKEIIKQLGNRAPPIIALTAAAMSSDRDNALEAGMVDFLSKPFTVTELSALMIKWIYPESVKKTVAHEQNKALI
jgi:PAS domain S-box-containing protein